ncbi:MAG: vWA domain-containing protein [Planctomycetaceae bacterium]
MKEFLKNAPSILVSLIVHVIVVMVMLLITYELSATSPDITLESIFTEDVPREQMEQRLELDTKPAETMNVMAGGTPSTAVGAAATPASAPVDVQKANVLNEATVDAPRVETMQLSDEVMATELGEGEITGEVGAMVEGYGDAMGRITQELVRMMRQDKVTVVWLFDESGSMVDDRKEIRENYLRVYHELGIATEQDKELKRRGSEQLLTVVASYGKDIHVLTKQPTANVELIRAAIDSVPIDETGEENMCQSVREIILKYRAMAAKRKLAVILVSDESGDDGNYVEEAIVAARQAKAPIFVMGRESMFGYPYASQVWYYEDKAKNIKEPFWLTVRRGPETAFPECLQWDGIERRWGGQSAGFGPYEQVRMAKESGGIFFVLPGNEANLVTRGENEQRKYDFLAIREYTPLLLSRREYDAQRGASPFRQRLWEVIATLNPNKNDILFGNLPHNPRLNIKDEHYALLPAEFQQQALGEVVKAAEAMVLVNQAIAHLDDIKPLRAKEASQRWRAAFDLAYAQLPIFRLRLFQFLLAMDQHANKMPPLKDPKSNEWNFWRNPQTIVPDEAQFDRLKSAFNIKMERSEYLAMVAEEEKISIERLEQVMKDHPGTPWARRAEREKSEGFGFVVGDRLWDPHNIRSTIKLPKL